MENKEQLPWDLIEEILSRVPPKSLVRFRIVSKQWNRLINDKTFLNNHKTTFRFVLRTKSKIYAVSINPKIELRELTLDIPGLESQIPYKLVDCNGILLCGMGNGAVVWNPWLGQTTWIEPEVNTPSLYFYAIGYDNDNRYKTLASHRTELDPTKTIWKIHDFSSHSWKNSESGGSSSSTQKVRRPSLLNDRGVSLDGSWYQAASDGDTSLFVLVMFDFSSEKFYIFCDLPCGGNTGHDALALGVFRGDRFSFLKQCHLTKKIEIWVTKNKIDKYRGQDVEWISFMEASVPDLPDLVQIGSYSQPSYVIEDKRLVVCSPDENGRAWIYVLGDNKLIRKNQIELVVDPWLLHCSLIPSLVFVPRGQREEAKLHV